jgi:pimeloyl-ACP methyl ester carboxylesterase
MVADYRGWHWFNPDTHTEMLPWARDRLNEITIPALVITGEHDIQEFQDIAALYANRLPNAQRVTLPGAAHMANMDDPTAFNRIVAKFIAENRMA